MMKLRSLLAALVSFSLSPLCLQAQALIATGGNGAPEGVIIPAALLNEKQPFGPLRSEPVKFLEPKPETIAQAEAALKPALEAQKASTKPNYINTLTPEEIDYILKAADTSVRQYLAFNDSDGYTMIVGLPPEIAGKLKWREEFINPYEAPQGTWCISFNRDTFYAGWVQRYDHQYVGAPGKRFGVIMPPALAARERNGMVVSGAKDFWLPEQKLIEQAEASLVIFIQAADAKKQAEGYKPSERVAKILANPDAGFRRYTGLTINGRKVLYVYTAPAPYEFEGRGGIHDFRVTYSETSDNAPIYWSAKYRPDEKRWYDLRHRGNNQPGGPSEGSSLLEK